MYIEVQNTCKSYIFVFICYLQHVTLNNNCIITHLKSGMNIDIQDFLRGVFVMKASYDYRNVLVKILYVEIFHFF